MDVLVVDDEPIARLSVARTLASAGYRVTTVDDGRAAWELLQHTPHQLVVSDWSMPRMDGVELCRRIRESGGRRYVYFVLLTSHVGTREAILGLQAGADDYVKKPFDPGELVMRVNTGRRIIGLETRGVAVFALAKLAESRDADTGAHLERVRSYGRILTERLQQDAALRFEIDDEFVQLIYETSPLHDIGKVAIPDDILRKPGKLTEAEFDVMKTHTLRGAETLDAAMREFPNARFLHMARNIALSHHERYDGTGYPQGLAGDRIPLCGRIVALADVYDALTSDRPYKSAWPHDRARDHIVEERGRHFDPAVVDAFLAVEDRFLAILNEMSDAKAIRSDHVAAATSHVEPTADAEEPTWAEYLLRSPSPPRALVVDDEPIARRMAVFALEREDFDCDSADDVDRAEALLAEHDYDLVVVDLRMPHRNGHTLAVELLRRPLRPVVVVHTAVDHPRMTEDLLARGVDDIVYKPTCYSTFAVRARVLVETRRGRIEARDEPRTAAQTCSAATGPLEAQGACAAGGTDRSVAGPLVAAGREVLRLAADDEATLDELVASITREPELLAEMLRLEWLGTDLVEVRRVSNAHDLVLRRGRRRVGELALLATVRRGCDDPAAIGSLIELLVGAGTPRPDVPAESKKSADRSAPTRRESGIRV